VPGVILTRNYFQGHFAAKKISEIWVMDPGKGMDYGIVEFYGF
jgi:hypothetical protein